ncbi:hypothetical protein BDZ89DRAFT_1134807 [Hymenopellis radicata]|nr:hypothetical protein BDZ89DRAFT_1134807 [Hymenopellis radicata]
MYNNDSNSESASYSHSPNRAVFWSLSDSAHTEYPNGGNQQRQSQTPEYHLNQTIVPPAPVSTHPQSSTVRPAPSYPCHRNPGRVDSMNAYDASGLPPAAQATYYAKCSQNPAFNMSTTTFHSNTTAGPQYDEVGLMRRPQARYHDRHGHPYLSRDHSISPSHTSSPALSRSSSMTSVGIAATATGYAVPENSFNENPRCRAPPPVAPVWTSAIDAEYQSSPHLIPRGVEAAAPERHHSSQEPPSDGMLRKKKKSKMHPCEICQHEFPRPSALRTHLNSHYNIRPYACPFPGCEKAFGVSSNVKRHLRTHGNFQSDENGAGAENPTYHDAYNPESSYRDAPASVNPTASNPGANHSSQQKSSFPYNMSNAVTRWLPASRMSRSNAAQLREGTIESSSSEYEEVSDDYSSSSDSSSVRSMQLTIPLPAVTPSLATDETDERYEERNSYLVMSWDPYHPS